MYDYDRLCPTDDLLGTAEVYFTEEDIETDVKTGGQKVIDRGHEHASQLLLLTHNLSLSTDDQPNPAVVMACDHHLSPLWCGLSCC